MTMRLRGRLRELFGEQPDTFVIFTDAITADSYFHAAHRGGSVLFLHSLHRQLVLELRMQEWGEGVDPRTAGHTDIPGLRERTGNYIPGAISANRE